MRQWPWGAHGLHGPWALAAWGPELELGQLLFVNILSKFGWSSRDSAWLGKYFSVP